MIEDKSMSNNFPILVKQKKVIALFFIVCSIPILWVSLLEGPSVSTLMGILLFAVGTLFLTRPIAVITPTTIEIKNLLGLTLKVHPYTPDSIAITKSGISLENKQILSTWISDLDTEKFRELMHSK
jgi:hypothetical protein